MKQLIMILFLTFSVSLFAQEIAKSYFFFDEEIQLELDPNEISIVYKNDGIQNLNNISEEINRVLDGHVASSKKMHGRTIQKIELDSDMSESQLGNYISELNKLDNVAMAAPVLRNNNVRQAVTDEFIVRFKTSVTAQDIAAVNKNLGGLIKEATEFGYYILTIPKSTGLNGLTAANLYHNASEIVIWAEPNFVYPGGDLYNATVNDPLHSSQWAHVNTGQTVPTESVPGTVTARPDADMDVDQAWDISTGDSDIIVAIIDSGVDLDHPDLDDNLVTGTDTSGDADGPDAPGDEAHGTNCAGLVAAEGDNGIGVAGIAYQCSIMPVQVFNSAGTTTNAALAAGINYAWQNGADILSNSWGGGSSSAAINSAIGSAKTSGRSGDGCVILFSSGNDGNGDVNYPAYLTDVIAVGASSMLDEKKNPGSADAQFWWGGNYGSDLDVVAPTVCYSTDIIGSAGYSATDYYSTFNGTSAACPNAAGVAALVLSVNPSLTSDQVQSVLENSADKIETYTYDASGWNKHVGYGRVNAYRALLDAQSNDGDVPLIQHVLEQSSNNTTARTISATITDPSGLAGGASQPTLYYRLTGNDASSAWLPVTDSNGPSGNVYEFVIPGQNLGILVEYYISATDNSVYNHTTTFPFGGGGATAPAVVLKYWVATLSTVNYASSDIGSWSSGAGSAIFDLNIADDFTIIDLDFNMTFTLQGFAFLTDFVMLLEHPDGQRAGLLGNNDGTAYSGTTLDDEAVTPITDGSGSHTGTFIADNHLDVFDGLSALGDWEFRIYDGNSFGGGNLSAWSVDITYTTDDVALPVELSSFNVISQAANAQLNWTTESELNNMGFIVSRSDSKDGIYSDLASHLTHDDLKGLGTSSIGKSYSFTDFDVSENSEYWYKITDIDYAGKQTVHGPLAVTIEKHNGPKAISGFIPKEFSLEQNYPNPFNPSTHFNVNIPQTDSDLNTLIEVYDILGKKVKTLYKGYMAPGQYKIVWDARNNFGSPLPAGMYIYAFNSAKFNSAKRMLLIK